MDMCNYLGVPMFKEFVEALYQEVGGCDRSNPTIVGGYTSLYHSSMPASVLRETFGFGSAEEFNEQFSQLVVDLEQVWPEGIPFGSLPSQDRAAAIAHVARIEELSGRDGNSALFGSYSPVDDMVGINPHLLFAFYLTVTRHQEVPDILPKQILGHELVHYDLGNSEAHQSLRHFHKNGTSICEYASELLHARQRGEGDQYVEARRDSHPQLWFGGDDVVRLSNAEIMDRFRSLVAENDAMINLYKSLDISILDEAIAYAVEDSEEGFTTHCARRYLNHKEVYPVARMLVECEGRSAAITHAKEAMDEAYQSRTNCVDLFLRQHT